MENYTYKGVTGTLPELCQHFDKNLNLVRYKILWGFEIVSAMETIDSTREIYSYKGITCELTDLCKHFDKPYSPIRNRLQNGWNIEKAMETSISL